MTIIITKILTTTAKYMSSGVIRLWSLNRIPAYAGSNEVESPNTGVAITYIHCCKVVLMAYNVQV